MRALGIDFGEKRIGLAVSDPDGRWALPLATLDRRTDRQAAHAIAAIARREGAGVLVLGEPLGLDGRPGEAAARARRFGARLEHAARLPVVFVDEALTTVEAAGRLREAGLGGAGAARRIDAAAAQVLLQEALESGVVTDEVPGGAGVKRWLWRLIGLGLLLVLAAAAAAGTWAWRLLNQPYRGYDAAEAKVDIRSGQGGAAILEQLAEAGVLAHAGLARAWLVYRLEDPPLIAGEYRFDEPLSTRQVLDKLIRGEVVTYPLRLIEGLTLDEIAESIASQGFGDLERLRAEVRRGELVADLDPAAEDLEGYLYPDTYHFARGTAEEEIVDTLLDTFRQRWREEIEPLLAADAARHGGTRPRGVRDVVTLASIVEKEARLDDERARIAGVYAHRLRRGIALYADPTVIYALKRLGTFDGNLRRPDLALDSPYNTYVYPGLPPGPICSPAVASLAAAAAPEETRYLYFVSRNDGSHVFAETLAEHNRNVDRWQRRYWRRRWAEERGSR